MRRSTDKQEQSIADQKKTLPSTGNEAFKYTNKIIGYPAFVLAFDVLHRIPHGYPVGITWIKEHYTRDGFFGYKA